MDNGIVIRPHKAGEPSLVVHFYYKLFEEQFAFLPTTEQYFLHAMMELFNSEDNRLWIAEENGKIIGSISVIDQGNEGGQIRLFGTHPTTQGKGVGKALMQTAMNYCKEKDYHRVFLWTIDICSAALHLYEKYGFKCTDTKPNDTWANYHMTEELWEYKK